MAMTAIRLLLRLSYGICKIRYSLGVVAMKDEIGALQSSKDFYAEFMKSMSHPRLTFLHRYMGDAMSPTLGTDGEILLVRTLPFPPLRNTFFAGDVVALMDPHNHEEYLVRRVVAVEGAEMLSTKMKDEPFVIGKDLCWVLSDNYVKDLKEARDSRTWGPISIRFIVGRVLYRFRSSTDHGSIDNSDPYRNGDKSVLEFELDVDEMARKLTETEQKDFH